jgi:hypothetical protein
VTQNVSESKVSEVLGKEIILKPIQVLKGTKIEEKGLFAVVVDENNREAARHIFQGFCC